LELLPLVLPDDRRGVVAITCAPIFSAFPLLGFFRAERIDEAARQAQAIPVFGRTGNFNSLFGRKNSLFARVGNFGGTAWNRWAFRNRFSEIGQK
jgi:hypothetical protein